MLAAISRRSLVHGVRASTRNVPNQLRTFHPPPHSPLLSRLDLRRRYLLTRANATFALQSRGIQFLAVPKAFLRFIRVPAGGIAALTAGFAYINYKVQGIADNNRRLTYQRSEIGQRINLNKQKNG